jgi:hypothetical protein
MPKLLETRLQKLVVLIGCVLIFWILNDVGENGLIPSIGITVLMIGILVCLQDYHMRFHLKIFNFIKKHKKFFIGLLVSIVVIAVCVWFINLYIDKKQKEADDEKFTKSESAYNNCVLSLKKFGEFELTYSKLSGTKFTDPGSGKSENQYYEEWYREDISDYYSHDNDKESTFVSWIIDKYPNICSQYDNDLIKYYIDKKWEGIRSGGGLKFTPK